MKQGQNKVSLFYLADYLFLGGIGFLTSPKTMLEIFFSTGDYSDLMIRFIEILM